MEKDEGSSNLFRSAVQRIAGGLIGKLSLIVRESRAVQVVNGACAPASTHRPLLIGRVAMEINCRRESVQCLASKILILFQQVR